jgi:hypothetical protein
MEKAPENGEESSHSAQANGMNELQERVEQAQQNYNISQFTQKTLLLMKQRYF